MFSSVIPQIVLLFWLIQIPTSKSLGNSVTSQMVLAVQHFNQQFFRNKTTTLSITIETDCRAAKYYFDELLYGLLEPLQDFKLKLTSKGTEHLKEFDYYNIVMVDSYESFRKLNAGIEGQHQDFSEYYLILLHQNSTSYKQDIQKIFDYCWGFYIINANILVQTEGNTIELYTYYPFSESHCHQAVVKVMNSERSLNDMNSLELFPQKIRNFHNCTLRAALWNVSPYLVLPKYRQYPLYFDGMEGHLLHVLANVMNFTIDYITPPNNEQRGLVLKNGTLTGAIKILQQKAADLSLGSFRCTLERSSALSPSIAFYQTMQVFTVLSAHEPWSTYEIITYPFSYYVWSILAGLFLFLSLVALILRHLQLKALEFLYGCSRYSTIVLNLTSTTLGQASLPEPKRNFARYLLTMWMLLTLVLRSSYQGLLYDFLNTQKTIAPPNTMTQLVQRGYKLIVNMATIDSFSDLPIIRDKLIEVLVMNISDAGGFPLLEADNSLRYVTGTPKDFLTFYVIQHRKYGVFHVLTDTIFTQQLCIYFTKHSYLTYPFDLILRRLRSFGLIDYWASQYFDDTFLEVSSEWSGAEVSLTLTQLYGVFEIQYYLWLTAVILFAGELLWSRYGRTNQIWLDRVMKFEIVKK